MIDRVRRNTIQLFPAYVSAYSEDDNDASSLPQTYCMRDGVDTIDVGMAIAHEHRRFVNVASTAIGCQHLYKHKHAYVVEWINSPILGKHDRQEMRSKYKL